MNPTRWVRSRNVGWLNGVQKMAVMLIGSNLWRIMQDVVQSLDLWWPSSRYVATGVQSDSAGLEISSLYVCTSLCVLCILYNSAAFPRTPVPHSNLLGTSFAPAPFPRHVPVPLPQLPGASLASPGVPFPGDICCTKKQLLSIVHWLTRQLKVLATTVLHVLFLVEYHVCHAAKDIHIYGVSYWNHNTKLMIMMKEWQN